MNKKILILVNHEITILKFRLELVERLLEEGHDVVISTPLGKNVEILKDLGCKVLDIGMDRHGVNPMKDVSILLDYYKLVKFEEPDIVLSFTIKPNIYGGIITRLLKVPFIPNITGLGNAISDGGFLKKLIIRLYKISMGKANVIFVQNTDNEKFFSDNHIGEGNVVLLPGSGVNIQKFTYSDIENTKIVTFLYAGRITDQKGIGELVKAFEIITSNNKDVELILSGFFEDEKFKEKILSNDFIKYIGNNENMVPIISKSTCVINPSYHEGMSNILLEAASMGRPLLASNIPGCKEIINQSKNGYLFESKSYQSIVDYVNKFLLLNYKEKLNMGKESRAKVEIDFDREIIVNKYLDCINRETR